jgi:hypothetical protein
MAAATKNEESAVMRTINVNDERHKIHQVASTNFSM